MARQSHADLGIIWDAPWPKTAAAVRSVAQKSVFVCKLGMCCSTHHGPSRRVPLCQPQPVWTTCVLVPHVRQLCMAQSQVRCAADGVQDPRLKGPLQETGLDADKVAAAVKVPHMLPGPHSTARPRWRTGQHRTRQMASAKKRATRTAGNLKLA